MWQYAFGYCLAHDRGVPLILDPVRVARIEQNDFEGYVLDKAFGIRTPLVTHADQRRIARWSRTPLLRRTRFFHHKKVRLATNIDRIGKHCYVSGVYQDLRYLTLRSASIRELFPLGTSGNVDSMWAKQIQESTAVAVHVRRGDYLSSRVLATQDVAYYRQAMDCIRSRLTPAQPKFFVFSDDGPWATRHLGGQEDVRIVGKTGRPSWDDLALMALCKHYIISNSSFSWWAAWLGQSEESLVVYPERWHQKEQLNTIMQGEMPKNWQRMDSPSIEREAEGLPNPDEQ